MGAKRSNNYSNLQKRCITAVILGPVVITLIFAGFPYLNTLIGFAVVIMWFEWVRMVVPRQSSLLSSLCIFLIVSVLLASLGLWRVAWASVILGSCLVWIVLQFLKITSRFYSVAAFLGFGAVGLSILSLRIFPGDGGILLLWLFVSVWVTDSGAYFFGKLFGGPKLAPSVSPGKTWAGLIGGVFCSGLWCLFAGLYFAIGSAIELAALGIILALLAQSGDLLMSKAKRTFMVKDTGSLLPGHGGLIDRLDGLLLTAPAFTVFVFA